MVFYGVFDYCIIYNFTVPKLSRSSKSKVRSFGAYATSPMPVMSLYASIASRHPMIFGTGPITGGTPLVNLDNSFFISSFNGLPFVGSENISS